jgi:hypothetical protein
MIITKLKGGLGNQMFQYAAGRSLSILRKTELKLDLSFYKNLDPAYRRYQMSAFNTIENIASKAEVEKMQKNSLWRSLERSLPYSMRSTIVNNDLFFDPNFFRIRDNTYIEGNWQNEKYFCNISDNIKSEFSLRKAVTENFESISERISKSHSISLHIRRGDYLSPKFSNIYPVLSSEYYAKAAAHFDSLLSDPIFFVFSDDLDWAKKNLNIPYPSVFVDLSGENKDAEEMVLMSRCRHNIIANSSFSWWGAWLNRNPDKIVISPKKWFNILKAYEESIIPKEWLTI